MTAEKANLAKKIPSSPKKKSFLPLLPYSPLTAAGNSSVKKSCTFFCRKNSLYSAEPFKAYQNKYGNNIIKAKKNLAKIHAKKSGL
jgi:hypothetical protein